MSSDPKRPIENLVEQSARTRRVAFGSEPKMPNPMRAQLHEEIERQNCSTGAPARASLFQVFWLRLAAAAVAVVLIGIPILRWRQTHQPSRIAAHDSAAPANGAFQELDRDSAQPLASAPSSTPRSSFSLADNQPASLTAPAPPATNADSLGPPEPSADAQRFATRGFVSAEPKLEAQSAALPAKESARLAAAGSKPDSRRQAALPAPAAAAATSANRVCAQQQVQSFRNASNRTQGVNVLNTFQFQQEGRHIRVVDADGSTYTGNIDSVAPTQRAAAKSKRSERDRADEPRGETRFRASGYNVSLKKPVIFEGRYMYMAPTPEQQENGQTEKSDLPAQEAPRIVGTAQVQGEQPLPVDATAVGSGGGVQRQ